MDKIAMAAFASSISKSGAFQLRDEFPDLGWHTVFPILLREAVFSLCSVIRLSTGDSQVNEDGLGMFKIRFKCFYGHFQSRLRIRAPKFLGVEAHGVEPLRIVAFAGRY